MVSTRQVDREGMLFVAGETPEVYQHTAGLVILDTSECPGFSFEHLKNKIIERIDEVPHFRWRLEEVPLGLDMPYWVEDEDFSYDNHFKRIAVPSPGDREALSEVVAHLYSRHLDRSRPLWELWLIEGLEGGRFALLQKLHHCLMDGQGASKLGELLCDLEPDAAPRLLDSTIHDAQAGEAPDWLLMSATTAAHLARFPGAMSRQVIEMVGPRVMESLGLKKRQRKPAAPAPVTRFNAEISSDRGFVFGSLPLADIKTVRKAFTVSVNDVLLALVSTSLRNYLVARGELPAQSLRTAIPVSLRTDDDENISNRVTQVPVTLATDLEDPVKRLKAISADCDSGKRVAHSGGKGFIEFIQVMPPWMVTAMMGLSGPEQAAQMLGSNLIVSNVHGSDHPLYIAGARLETMYPMSIITRGMGVNFTCVSYAGKVDVGVTLAPELVPDPWQIVDGLAGALKEYRALAGKAAKRRPAPRKSAKRGGGKKAPVKGTGRKGNTASGKKSANRRRKTAATGHEADSRPSA
jgi:diacylglycerol O-acyltransferase